MNSTIKVSGQWAYNCTCSADRVISQMRAPYELGWLTTLGLFMCLVKHHGIARSFQAKILWTRSSGSRLQGEGLVGLFCVDMQASP